MAALSPRQQETAVKLYISGKSARQVAEYFGVSLDAVFYVLRHRNVPRRTASEANRITFEAKPLSYRIKERLSTSEERLKLAAVMLYWAEGYKISKGTIDFTNSDPAMAVVFKRFLTEICRIDEDRVRCQLYCYEGQSVKELLGFGAIC